MMSLQRLYLLILTMLFVGNLSAQLSKAPRDYIDLLVTPVENKWNCKVGEEAKVRVLAYAGGMPIDGVELFLEAGNEMMPVDMETKAVLTGGEATMRCGTMNQPGFRSCKVHFVYEGKRYQEQVKIGFSPEKVLPTVVMPADFQQFWKKALAEAAKIPADVQVTPMPNYSTENVDVSLIRLQCYKASNYVYGYLCKPKKAGTYPVLMTPPGAGIKGIQPDINYAEHGFISLTMEVHGLSPLADDTLRKNITASIGDYINSHLESPDTYYYKKVYLSCVRAMDYLISLPEFDGKNIGVCGGSQGGALSIVTAALDKRVTFLAAFYPALSDMTGFLAGRAGGWPKMFAPDGLLKLSTDVETARNTLAYYDVVNFARMLTAPGFYSFGYNDNTCPPTSVCAALNVITAPKVIVVTPVSAHWRFPETNAKSIEWMKSKLK